MAKIDLNVLHRLLNEGYKPAEAARRIGVNRSSVTRAIAKSRVKTSQAIVLGKAGRIVEGKIDVMDQLLTINAYAVELLDLLMRWNRGDKAALQVLESQISRKKVRVGNKEEFVKEYKFTDPRSLALRTMAEIREQLRLQVDIFKSLYNVEMVNEFQKEIIRILGEIDPEARQRFIARLNELHRMRTCIEAYAVKEQ